MFFIEKKDLFLICSDSFSSAVSSKFYIDTECTDAQEFFLGYCFQNDKLYHDSYKESPNVNLLEDTYSYNCGVFCSGIIKNITRVFTDPLGQYPVFFYKNNESFIVSNNFFAISSLLDEKEFNVECMLDYVTYLSPLKQETILENVYRLTSFQTIEITNNTLSITTRKHSLINLEYDELIRIGASRIKKRAKALLEDHNPLCHLTGGGDSRLALSSLLSNGFKGSVFSYGDGNSEDRLISNLISNSYDLSEGVSNKFNLYVNDLKKYIYMSMAFNGLKSSHFSNWGGSSDYDYSEVTGYYGEMLKGFGNIHFEKDMLPKKVNYHSYYRKHSNFSDDLFDQADIRVREELSNHQHFDKPIINNIMFYLRNRCSSHCGMHSVVSNRKFISIDLDYDPIFLSIVNSCNYSESDIKAGAITVDLIKEIHSEELAILPYQGRVIPRYSKWTNEIKDSPSCFEFYKPDYQVLRKMEVMYRYTEPDFDFNSLGIENLSFTGPSKLFQNDFFSDFYDKYPVFNAALTATKGDKRHELTSLSSLMVCELITQMKPYNFNK